jgi:NTE family protein
MAEHIGLILSGGGARGAYEIGVLSELLPWLGREHAQRPDVIVGTSVGALNTAYIAAKADEDMEQLVADGARLWFPTGRCRRTRRSDSARSTSRS